LKSDDEDEYCDGRFEQFYTSQGIQKVKTVFENSHQNRVVEYVNMTILKRAHSVWIHAGLPK